MGSSHISKHRTMPLEPILLWSLIAATGIIVGSYRGLRGVGDARRLDASARPGRGRSPPCVIVLWRDPGDVASARSGRRTGRRRRAAQPSISICRRAPRRLAAVPVGDRRTRPALAREVGRTRSTPKPSPSASPGRAATSPRPPTSSRRAPSTAPPAPASRRLPRRPVPLHRGAVRARRSSGQEAVRGTQLGVERQSVPRLARAARAEDPRHAALELGHQGPSRRRARIQHGDLRARATRTDAKRAT